MNFYIWKEEEEYCFTGSYVNNNCKEIVRSTAEQKPENR